jgi:hypothetical protein
MENSKTGGAVRLVNGAAEVKTPAVTAASRIFLCAQDDQTGGVLRVSSRTPGEGFTFASSGGADSGVVAWNLYND